MESYNKYDDYEDKNLIENDKDYLNDDNNDWAMNCNDNDNQEEQK
jgi:hypothetical protein